MKELPRNCWQKRHETYEDMNVFDIFNERLFFCKSCGIIWICEEKDNKLIIKKELPISASNKQIQKYLTIPEEIW